MTRPDVEVMRALLAERVETHLASCLEVDRAEDGSRLLLGLSSAECRTILAALRSTGTGRSEAEAMREACIKACEDRIAYLEDPRRDNGTCMRYGRGELRSAIYLIRRIPVAARALPTQTAGGAE